MGLEFRCLVQLISLVTVALVLNVRAANYPPTVSLELTSLESGVWLSQVAYCSKDDYASYPFSGTTEGFEVDGTIYDSTTDIQGYYGRLPSAKQIWVVYRGSSSKMNWLDDGEILLVDPGYSGCSTCRVHKGFNKCSTNTLPTVEKGVATLRASNPTYSVFVTGHSLGAAVATLIAVSLKQAGVDAYLYNCGSPRVGNSAFSNYVSTLFVNDFVPQRLTHHKDTVPHVPYESLGYMHITNEVYEDENGVLHGCVGPHDPTCAEQYAFYQTNTADHLVYLGHNMTGYSCVPANSALTPMLHQISKHTQLNN